MTIPSAMCHDHEASISDAECDGLPWCWLVILALIFVLAACSPPIPTAEPATQPTSKPTARPTATPTPLPLLDVTLSTDSLHYKPSKVEIHLTLTNHGDEAVYLPICGPWALLRASEQRPLWFIECEIDYLGHKVEPGQSLADSVQLYLDAGSYRVRTEVYGNGIVGEPQSISIRETYYGEFGDCTVRQAILSDPFGVE